MASRNERSLKESARGQGRQRLPAGNAPAPPPPVIPGKGTPPAPPAAKREAVERLASRIAFAVLAGESPTSFVVQCPWCSGEHVHYPGQDLVQHCPNISATKAKYAVMIPLSQLPERT